MLQFKAYIPYLKGIGYSGGVGSGLWWLSKGRLRSIVVSRIHPQSFYRKLAYYFP